MPHSKSQLSTHVRSLLAGLRWRIRAYVWFEGLAVAILWLGLTFWSGLAIDYLPVLAGASEMPRAARAVLLTLIAGVLAYVLYRWILRRTFVRLADHSMAVLLERRFDEFHDSLVTSVELNERPDHATEFSQSMLDHASDEALSHVESVNLRRVFRLGPLAVKFVAAIALIVPIGVLYSVNANAVEIWINRLYLLKDDPWPRNTYLEVVGIELDRPSLEPGQEDVATLIPFEHGEVRVARGSTMAVRVRADAGKVVPEFCTIYYRTAENDRGRVNMSRIGRVRDDSQDFIYKGKPFSSMISSLDFDVRGLDYRARDYRITVVDSPVLIAVTMDCDYPAYMVDENLSLSLPRTVELTSGKQLPRGTKIQLRARTNKALRRVTIHLPESDETTTIDLADSDHRDEFVFPIESLDSDLALEVTLHDMDGVVTDRPHRLFIGCIEDEPPLVNVVLKGIGSAVTPNVIVPASGTISDDYGVEKSWFDVIVNDSEPRQFAIDLARGGTVDSELDFRLERSQENGLVLAEKDRISLRIQAQDRFDLESRPNIGDGDLYTLEVVTPEQLLAMLDRRELDLRRRFEQIIEEMTEMRDLIARIKTRRLDGQAALEVESETTEPADEQTPPDPAEELERARALRLLRTQRSQIQSLKSSQEILGVATSFDDIREELMNNRVDSEDRKTRLQQQISQPLHHVVEVMFSELDEQLKDLESKIGDEAASDVAADLAGAQTDEILLELDKVLQRMLELETFNELVNIVRALLEDQDELIRQTKEQQTKSALDILK